MSNAEPVVVVHVGLFPTLDDTQRAELRRVLGEPATVVPLSPLQLSPDELVSEIRRLNPDVILLNPAGPPYTSMIRDLSNEGYAVIETISEEQSRESKWQHRRNVERRTTERFRGFGL